MTTLTPTNFVTVINAMGERERKKLRLEDILDLILQVPENLDNVHDKVSELIADMEQIKAQANKNSNEILAIKTNNFDMRDFNAK